MIKKKNRVIEYLKIPDAKLLIPHYIVTCCGVVASILLSWSKWAFIVYIFTVLFSAYSIYTIIRIIYPKTKRLFLKTAKQYRFANNILENYGFRTVVFAAGAFIINIGYAIFEGVMGIISHSIWYGSLALYYVLLSVIRGVVILREYKIRRSGAEEKSLAI